MGIIVLLLAIGVPAFNAMAVEQRLSKTRQLLNGTLMRTHIVSISDDMPAAVRLLPGEWHLNEAGGGGVAAGRQIMTTYREVSSSSPDPDQPLLIKFEQRFERIADGPTHVLPPDTWIAPSEALDDFHRVLEPGWGDYVGNYVLNGEIGHFTLNADETENGGERLLDADDFLIIFDPETGVRNNSLRREPSLLVGYDPDDKREWAGRRDGSGAINVQDRFQRFNFTGTVIYRREPFTALGADANSEDAIIARRNVLKRFGQTYYVHRTGGSLVAGAGE